MYLIRKQVTIDVGAILENIEMLKPQLLQAIPSIESFLRYCQIHEFKAKSSIIKAGEPSESLYFILEGSVTVLLEDEDGREMVASYLNPGDFFGEMGLYEAPDGEPRSAAVRTKTDGEVAQISYERSHQLRDQIPDILFAISKQMAARLRHTNNKLSDLAFVDVSGRVAHTLIDLCTEPDAMTHPDGMQIKITRQELGRIVGCSREMAGRVLKTLEEEGLVGVSGKTMVVYGTR